MNLSTGIFEDVSSIVLGSNILPPPGDDIDISCSYSEIYMIIIYVTLFFYPVVVDHKTSKAIYKVAITQEYKELHKTVFYIICTRSKSHIKSKFYRIVLTCLFSLDVDKHNSDVDMPLALWFSLIPLLKWV
jgi:hypothetical protein